MTYPYFISNTIFLFTIGIALKIVSFLLKYGASLSISHRIYYGKISLQYFNINYYIKSLKMIYDKRIVKQWVNWKLICAEAEEYLLARHDGLDIDFDAPNDEEAIKEAIRLMREIEGEPTSI